MCLSEIHGGRIKLWTPVHEVESAALDQLKAIANLPWVFKHVAAMPDVHLGKGATVGSVIAMRDALAPAAVGVDIGCVDADTEFLTPHGWKKIANYRPGDKVMEYHPESGVGSFVTPINYIEKPATEWLIFKTKYGIDQKLSPDHRVLYRKTSRLGSGKGLLVVDSALNIADKHDAKVLGFRGRILTTFKPETPCSMAFSDEEIRVRVMIAADGYFRKRGPGDICRLRFKKDRKIQRAKTLLTNAGYDFSEKVGSDGVTTINFKAGHSEKSLGYMWALAPDQLRVVADECLYWDGNLKDRVFFTRDKASADLVQYAMIASGYRASMRLDGLDYRVFASSTTEIGIASAPKTPVKRVKANDGEMQYCFQVPSTFWVMRRNGQVAITGNCGMGAVRTNLKASDLPESLRDIRLQIERDVPVGFNWHDRPAALRRNRSGETIMDGFKNLRAPHVHAGAYESKAHKQLGTLGGGNHFIEICLDTEQNVWVMLHSGSRNIGKELAEYHIGIARGLIHNAALPDRDLAVFLRGTPEMEAYRHDLTWAQQYAFANRSVMKDLVMNAIRRHLPTITEVDYIACHHNYVSEETHFGEKVIVTRKGAIYAGRGVYGIIPGSMGTKSYIVRGLGNPESYESASHGAGRRMSRGAAKRNITMDEFKEQVRGVECRTDAGVLDEAPAAYKAIEQVMANQADLVEIVHELRQVLCVKG